MSFFTRKKKKKNNEEISASTTKTKKLSVAERRAKRKTKKKSLYRIEEQTTTVDESNDGDDEVLDLSMDEVMNEDPFQSPTKLNSSSKLMITRSKDSRIQSLEDQLVKNARLFAKEATDLKLKIQEYQMSNELMEEAF